MPRRPSGLSPEAAAHWDQLTGLLSDAGTLSSLDADALTLYIALWDRYRKAEEMIALEGPVITAKNGYEQPSPWYTISVQCLKDLKSFLTVFGLTPMARSKLKLPEAEPIDPKWKDFE